jgi:hypothetical protein
MLFYFILAKIVYIVEACLSSYITLMIHNIYSLEKIRPEKELERAKAEILRCKIKIREAFRNMDSLLSKGKLEDSLFDSAGEIFSENVCSLNLFSTFPHILISVLLSHFTYQFALRVILAGR